MNRESLVSIINSLNSGEEPVLNVSDFPSFSEGGKNPYLNPEALERLASQLSKDDVVTFERALKAVDDCELAWLGFKIVYDSDLATSNVDNEVTKKYGETGSADGESLVFFCNDSKEIVSSREPSPRDMFQMKDVTRGPSMHNEQFEGLVWTSVALCEPIQAWVHAGGGVACELEKIARHVG